jgi:hypothetical protein
MTLPRDSGNGTPKIGHEGDLPPVCVAGPGAIPGFLFSPAGHSVFADRCQVDDELLLPVEV